MTLAWATDARSDASRSVAHLISTVLLVGASLNGLAVRIIESWKLHGFEQPLLGMSSFEILAIVVGARGLLRPSGTHPAVGAQLALAVAVIVPSSVVAWFAVGGFALLGAGNSQGDRRAGFLLFAALASSSIWSSVLLKWWAEPAAALDAEAVRSLLSWWRTDLAVTGNVVGVPTGHNLIIMTACTTASVFPKTLLGLAALAVLGGAVDVRRLATAAVAVAASSAGLNLLRLSLMASSASLYSLIHGPVGANAFDAVQTLSVVGWGLWVSRP